MPRCRGGNELSYFRNRAMWVEGSMKEEKNEQGLEREGVRPRRPGEGDLILL